MWFDTSEFAADHPSEIPTSVNKKVIGMMKDEAGGKIIQEFVAEDRVVWRSLRPSLVKRSSE